MKTNLFLISILITISVFSVKAQVGSVFTNPSSYNAKVCTHSWDSEGLDEYEHLTIFSDDPMSDTLRVKDVMGNVFANLWIHDRKTWLKVNSDHLPIASQYVYFPEFNNVSGYPLDEYFLLYDFSVLDAVSVGDTVSFSNQWKDVSFSIAAIDTIQINNIDKVRYSVYTNDNQWTDYLIEGIGGLHPFTPILRTGLFGFCTCEYEINYKNPTDSLKLNDNEIFGTDVPFCLATNELVHEKLHSFTVSPNPVLGNSFSIQAEENSRIDEIRLFDNLGKEVKANFVISENSDNCIVSAINMSSGFYTIEIIGNSKFSRKKIIVR